MKYKEYQVNETKIIIIEEETKIKYRMSEKDFTRKRKMNFDDVIKYILNKKGLTNKMEIEEFNDINDVDDISSPGVLKQRKKVNGEIFKDMMQHNLVAFYNNDEFKSEVKLYKGYIISAIDGSDFEIPNTETTRKNYDSTKDNTSVARAHVSNCFDILNHYIMSTVIGPETSDEREMEKIHLEEIKRMNLIYSIIRTKDRGYVSYKDLYYSVKNDDKFVVRLKKSDFKEQVANMTSDDEIVEIPYNDPRIRYYKDKDPEFYQLMTEKQESIKVRFVKIVLSTGETEILMTNLSQEEMTTDDIKEIYRLRWGIETNFHYLKESLKIETITSSIDNLIKQDIYGQMFVFNLLQSFVNDAQENINQLKYKHPIKVNFNMAVGHFKKLFIHIIIEEDKNEFERLWKELETKLEKYFEPVRPNRHYPRKKDKKNKYSINKRKSF